MTKEMSEFMKNNAVNRKAIEEKRKQMDEVVTVFEEAGYGFGGFDERTYDAMLLCLYALLIEKKVFSAEEVSQKLKDIKEVGENK